MSTCFTPNPEPWSSDLPRLLGHTHYGHRVILDTEGVHVERKEIDRLGAVSWVEKIRWSEIVDGINLDADEWLAPRYNATGYRGAFVEDGEEGFSLFILRYETKKGTIQARSGDLVVGRTANGVFRKLSATQWYDWHRVVGPPNAWVMLDGDRDAESASQIKCSLLFRLMGGDPAVTVTMVSR